MPKIFVPEKLKPLITKKKRFKVIIGGRGSGKSHTVADICLMDAQTKGMKIGCFREFQNSLSDSVYSLLSDEVERLELTGFKVQASTIETESGGRFVFNGLARNPESIKSMQGFQRFVVEEAQTISDKSLRLLTPTLRTEESELWFIANPQSSADPLSQRFIVPYLHELERNGFYEDDLHLIIVCNYTDNKFFPEVLEKERAFDYEHLPRAAYDHVWLGKFNDTVDNSIVKPEWFDACIDAHLNPDWKITGKKVVSHDPSDTGDDNKGLCYRHGSLILDIQEQSFGDISDGCDWATGYAIKVGADQFVWDCDGMGIGLRRQIADNFKGQRIEQSIFKGSEGADNPDGMYEIIDNNSAPTRTNKQTFRNKRSQMYMRLADRMYRTYRTIVHNEYNDTDDMISFSSDISCMQALRSEVCRIPRKENGNGLIQIMSKIDMAKLKIKSPNMADSLMMSLSISDKIAINEEYIPPVIRSMGRSNANRRY